MSSVSDYIFWNQQEQNLQIDWSEALGYPCKLSIAAWDKGLHWLSRIYDEIHRPELHEEHGVNLLAPTDHPAINEWQDTIPEDIRTSLVQFKHWRLSLLQLVRNWREAKDLLVSNPLLLWLTRDYAEEHNWSTNEFRYALTLKQPVLLKKIGLIGTKSSNKLLKKIEFDSLDRLDSHFIRNAWENEELITRLAHQKRITIRLLKFYKEYPWIAARPLSKVFDSVECIWAEKELSTQVRDSHRMAVMQLEIPAENIERRLAACSSVEAVERVHNNLAHRLNEMYARQRAENDLLNRKKQATPFPAPPHPGTSQIMPITTPDELSKEGSYMRHCAASYRDMVHGGEYYFYRMELPIRLTIGVTVINGKIVALDQVKARFNKNPERDIKTIVEDWFVIVQKANNILGP